MAKARRGVSLNVARALGYVSTRPPEIDPLVVDLPCKYSNVWHQGGMSSKDLYLLSKSHREAVQGEYRL